MWIIARIIIGIIGGLIGTKVGKNKRYVDGINFTVGFIFPFLGNWFLYSQKDKKEDYDEREDDELNKIIEKLQK